MTSPHDEDLALLIASGAIVVDRDSHEVRTSGVVVALSTSEYDVLRRWIDDGQSPSEQAASVLATSPDPFATEARQRAMSLRALVRSLHAKLVDPGA